MSGARKTLGKILEEMKVISADQIREALKLQKTSHQGKRIGEILVEKGWATPQQIAKALAIQFELPYTDLKNIQLNPELLQLVPKSIAEENKVFPVKKEGNVLTIAISDPLDLYTLDNLRFLITGVEIECVLSSEDEILKAIEHYYSGPTTSLESVGSTKDLEQNVDVSSISEGDEAPIIRLANLIITEAVKAGVSDIHVEPTAEKVRIRYRLDGVCTEVDPVPKKLQASFISRLKLMAGMPLEEKRKPLDGKIKMTVLGKSIDIRVASLPSRFGESIVMRILDREAGLVDVDVLGFHPSDFQRFQRIIKRPNGIILVTGPTGSGKTTTLYAVLKQLNKISVKIITAENPVEYVLPGINQSQVNTKVGLTFARIVRAMLRQAPNIILVGEIRDKETAETAVQAALTGHLVFSTLHTNDAPSAVTRLVDIGIKPFLVASSLQAILAQRLVRILCPNCKEPHTPTNAELKSVGLKPEDLEGKTLYKPVGCPNCKGTGFKGRKGIFELLELTEEIRELIFKNSPTEVIKEAAISAGMVTLLKDGVRKILDGLTTIDEVLAVARREDIGY